MRKLTILGSTGSIGQNCLNVVERFPDELEVVALTAHRNAELLAEQALIFKPRMVVIADEKGYFRLRDKLRPEGIEVWTGEEALSDVVSDSRAGVVVNALVGAVGLKPTLAAVENGKVLALANKESLVMAGSIIVDRVSRNGASLVPIDSEHSAILQCLQGEEMKSVTRLILTASGGPFLNTAKGDFGRISITEALAHPKWNMGKKITIDSATLMNKGLEVIEAHWLFGIGAENIEVIIHPQSIIHSLVEFEDGSIKAQLGYPDMKIPILYALFYPHRRRVEHPKMDFASLEGLTFQVPDGERFPCLGLAYEALASGGSMPTVLNAANEAAVGAFLKGQIPFNRIPHIIEDALSHHRVVENPSINEILGVDDEVREQVLSWIGG